MKMLQKVAYIMVGVVLTLGATLTSQAIAATGTKTATLTYKDIKVVIDGVPTTLTDLEGRKQEPFILDGTVYAPFSATARAFGKTSQYEGTTATVYISSGTGTATQAASVYLSSLDYFNASNSNGGFILYDSVKDNFGNTYTNGLGGRTGDYRNFQEYNLNGAYSQMTGRVVLNYDARTQTNNGTAVVIKGDGEVLYQSGEIKAGFEPQDFSINLSQVKNLRVEIVGTNMIRLVNCKLVRK